MKIELNIRELRIQKGLSIGQLAHMCSISKSHLSDIERGVKMPSLYICIRLTMALKCKIEDLYKIINF